MRQFVIDKLVLFWGIYSSVIKVSVMDILKCLIIKGLLSVLRDSEVSKSNHNYYYYVFYFMLVYG